MKRIQRCPKDGRYTLQAKCPLCDAETITTQPPKYSVDDKYGSYRRDAKSQARKDEGTL
jgi:H/ACA ribonucleoprotein complex subunit 3